MIFSDNLYLDTLTLKNFATFKDQTIQFDKSFNAITGETGSGKSLILDALELILGHRADKKLIRKGSDYSTIEASFICNDQKIIHYLDEYGFPIDNNEVIIKRIIYSNGKSKSYLNFQQCNLQTLTKFAKEFIDLVGQFENQKLLSENYQLVLLDRYAKNTELKESFNNSFNHYKELVKKAETLQDSNQKIQQRADYLEFQVKEFNDLNPNIKDEKELLEKKKIITNFEKISTISEEVKYLIDGNDSNDGILNLLRRLSKVLNAHNDVLNVENLEHIEDFYSWISDVSYHIENHSNIDINEDEVKYIFERLDTYQKLKRKFNADTLELEDLHLKFKEELRDLELMDDNLSQLKHEILAAKERAYDLAYKLHQTRLVAAKKLSKVLTKKINELRMIGAQIIFEVDEVSQISLSGISKVSLTAQTNPGEGFYKVKDIASGGELSRILLALRQVISGQDSISIFLFDEVDSGIGGETALCIGQALSNVSRSSQVIAITHLPQIATFSNKIILVSKNIDLENKRTISKVEEITGNKIKHEVKKMIPEAQA